MATPRCCHANNSWLLFPGSTSRGIEWCYRCGAYRTVEREVESVAYRAASPWVRPTGPGGENPIFAHQKRCDAFVAKKLRGDCG